MSLTFIILLILFGLILLLLEILVIPGLIVGIIGACMMLFGVIAGYTKFGGETGNYILLGTIACSIVLIWFVFRANTWKKVTLHSAVDGKVNTFDNALIKAGEAGVSISRLAPAGMALINDIQVEVESVQGFVTENKPLVVIKVDGNKIFVKPTE